MRKLANVAAVLGLSTVLWACEKGILRIEPDIPENEAPVADAGDDIDDAATWMPVRLSGSASDADGDPVTYSWTIVAPSGTEFEPLLHTTARPAFTPDEEGTYLGIVVVNDGEVDSAPDTVRIQAADTRITETIGPEGGSIGTADGRVTITAEPGALDQSSILHMIEIPSTQIEAIGAELAAKLRGQTDPMAFVVLRDEDLTTEPDTVLKTSTESPQGSPSFTARMIQYINSTNRDSTQVPAGDNLYTSDAGLAAPLHDQSTSVDLDDDEIVLTGYLDQLGIVVQVPPKLEVSLSGFPQQAVVGESFNPVLEGDWNMGAAIAEELVSIFAEPPLVEVGPVPGGGEFRTPVTAGTFRVWLEYRCESVGEAFATLEMVGLQTAGAPLADGVGRTLIQKTVECVPPEARELPKGLHELPGVRDPEAAFAIRGPLGPIQDTEPSVVFFSGLGGYVGLRLTDRMIVVHGVRTSSNPLTRISIASRNRPPTAPGRTGSLAPGADVPAVIFGSGVDFANPTAPFGGEIYGYGPGDPGFAETPIRAPGAYWDQSPAAPVGDVVTTEIVAATNYGVDFIRWDDAAAAWVHVLDDRLPLARYDGALRASTIGTATAVEAGGPVLVTANYFGVPGRLFFDDRTSSSPTDMGELGASPTMIRCAPPLCVVVLARDNAIRTILWDGATEPTIVGDPIPVGLGPGAVALEQLASGITLALTLTGYDDDVVTLTELDDAANVLSSTDVDMADLGCRGPRGGAWLPNAADPDNPYVVITCFNDDSYYVTDRNELNGG